MREKFIHRGQVKFVKTINIRKVANFLNFWTPRKPPQSSILVYFVAVDTIEHFDNKLSHFFGIIFRVLLGSIHNQAKFNACVIGIKMCFKTTSGFVFSILCELRVAGVFCRLTSIQKAFSDAPYPIHQNFIKPGCRNQIFTQIWISSLKKIK